MKIPFYRCFSLTWIPGSQHDQPLTGGEWGLSTQAWTGEVSLHLPSKSLSTDSLYTNGGKREAHISKKVCRHIQFSQRTSHKNGGYLRCNGRIPTHSNQQAPPHGCTTWMSQ